MIRCSSCRIRSSSLDVRQDLGVAVKEPLVLLLLEVGLGRGMLEGHPVAHRGAIARQQNERRCIGCLRREGEIQQDERIWVKRPAEQECVGAQPDCDQHRLQDQEPPAPEEAGDSIGDPRAERGFIDQYPIHRVLARRHGRRPLHHGDSSSLADQPSVIGRRGYPKSNA